LLGVNAQVLLAASNITVLEGDIEKMDFDTDLVALKSEVNIIIHLASTINLARPLKQIKNMIVRASMNLAEFGTKCDKLERFVYVSTAYANAHLHQQEKSGDVRVEEEIYPFTGFTTAEEWKELLNYDEPLKFKECIEQFPYAYAYAKHFTERLLLEKLGSRLLIVRPSIIGPAQSFPFEGYAVPLSTPSTMFSAAIMMTPSRDMVLATRLSSPMAEGTSDEVPVDVVADRLLAHLAFGTTGAIHAVAGSRARTIFGDWFNECLRERRLPWKVKPVWKHIDWHSPELHPISRTTVIFGTSFDFAEGKTTELWLTLEDEERMDWQLFAEERGSHYDLSQRRKQIRFCMQKIAKRSRRARLLVNVFYRDYGVE